MKRYHLTFNKWIIEQCYHLTFSALTSTAATAYIKKGENIELTCELTVVDASEIKSIKWYNGATGVELIGDSATVESITDATFTDDKQKTTYVDNNVAKTAGGRYKCEFEFVTGDPISAVIDVAVHRK